VIKVSLYLLNDRGSILYSGRKLSLRHSDNTCSAVRPITTLLGIRGIKVLFRLHENLRLWTRGAVSPLNFFSLKCMNNLNWFQNLFYFCQNHSNETVTLRLFQGEKDNNFVER
jgi:hypothetical protein